MSSQPRIRVTLAEFHAAIRAQDVPMEHAAFRCPLCSTVQSATTLIRAGAGTTCEEVEPYLGFSCVGRWTGQTYGSHTPGQGCDWTLGGLLQLHDYEVVLEDGSVHPRFAPVTADEADALRASYETPA